ncbi:MAG: DmsC/YnfH family molybdoenzyme membrane anchor subunit [Desulfobacterales bacterium]
MHNWSLVCFTLFTQSAIGLVWVSVAGRWFGGGTQADFSIWPMSIALTLTGLGLYAALAHLAKPRLAPNALRNLTASWLSREVLLVQAFAGAVALLIFISLLEALPGLVILETTACLLGGAALFAMTRVYLLKTVPVWNSPATLLEFAGSAMLLGGALGAVLTVFGATDQTGKSPALIAAAIGILLGLILKLTAIFPSLAAEQAARDQTWYEPTVASLSIGRSLAVRIGLNLAGLALILAAISGSGPTWLWSCLSLACLGTGEVVGRQRFYKAYRRLGV